MENGDKLDYYRSNIYQLNRENSYIMIESRTLSRKWRRTKEKESGEENYKLVKS